MKSLVYLLIIISLTVNCTSRKSPNYSAGTPSPTATPSTSDTPEEIERKRQAEIEKNTAAEQQDCLQINSEFKPRTMLTKHSVHQKPTHAIFNNLEDKFSDKFVSIAGINKAFLQLNYYDKDTVKVTIELYDSKGMKVDREDTKFNISQIKSYVTQNKNKCMLPTIHLLDTKKYKITLVEERIANPNLEISQHVDKHVYIESDTESFVLVPEDDIYKYGTSGELSVIQQNLPSRYSYDLLRSLYREYLPTSETKDKVRFVIYENSSTTFAQLVVSAQEIGSPNLDIKGQLKIDQVFINNTWVYRISMYVKQNINSSFSSNTSNFDPEKQVLYFLIKPTDFNSDIFLSGAFMTNKENNINYKLNLKATGRPEYSQPVKPALLTF